MLPPINMVTKDHLKAVLSENKKFLKMERVRFCNPPLYDEIGVKRLYKQVMALKGMSEYFPDKYPKGVQCDRSYFYNVWNTIYPEDVRQTIEHANSVRYSITSDKVKEQTIIISDAW